MRDRGLLIRLGLFLVFSIAALLVLLMVFRGRQGLFEGGINYQVTFPEAPGVDAGTPVRRSGVRVGAVNDVTLDPVTGLVRVQLQVDPRFVPRDRELITISRNLISGDTAIEFVPRDPELVPPDLGQPLPADAKLIGVAPPVPRALVAQVADVLPTVQDSMDQIRRSVERFEQAAPRLEQAFAEFGRVGKNLNTFLPELRRTNDELRGILEVVRAASPEFGQTNQELRSLLKNGNNFVEEVRQIVQSNEPELSRSIRLTADTLDQLNQLVDEENRKRLEDALENLVQTTDQVATLLREENQRAVENTLKNLSASSNRFPRITDNVTKASERLAPIIEQVDEALQESQVVLKNLKTTTSSIAARSDAIVANLDTSLQQINQLFLDIRELIRVFARSDGTVQRLLMDPSLFNQINAAAVQVTQLVPRIERILADVEVFSDKIARHPERIGVGGALRPSSGLKESPAAPLDYPRRRFP